MPWNKKAEVHTEYTKKMEELSKLYKTSDEEISKKLNISLENVKTIKKALEEYTGVDLWESEDK